MADTYTLDDVEIALADGELYGTPKTPYCACEKCNKLRELMWSMIYGGGYFDEDKPPAPHEEAE